MALERPGFDFASRDYSNIRRDLLARAERTIPEWTDRDPSDFSMVLVDMWAYMGDILHYYIDRAAGESFLDTATQKESVLALANLFDYKPRNKTAAKATVQVSNSKLPYTPISVITAVYSSTYGFTTYTTTTPHGFVAGNTVEINSATPSSYNTTGTINSNGLISSTSFYLSLFNGNPASALGTDNTTTFTASGSTITAASTLVTGKIYTIAFVGTTNFMLLGAASNAVGVVFTKNSTTGIGTGTASWTGTFTGLTQSATDGSGAGAVFSITKTGTGVTYSTTSGSANITVTVNVGGSNYQVGNTIKILGTSLGGATPANDLTLTVATKADGLYVSGGIVEDPAITYPRPITIPAETTFSGTFNNTLYNFYSESAVSVTGGNTVAVPIKEGTVISAEQLTTSSSGQIGQRYKLSRMNVIPNTIEVSVNEDGTDYVNWTRVEDLNIVSSGVNAYAVYVNSANETEVAFGNRLSGRIPPTGVKIQAKYKTTSGSSGNVGANSIKSINVAISGLSVAASTSAIGGTDGETVASLKTSIKSIIKSQDRAVTLNDFVNRVLLIDGVYKAVCVYVPSTSTGGTLTVHAIPYIADFTSMNVSTYTLETETKTAISSALNNVATLGVTIENAGSVAFVPKNISASINIDDTYVQSSVVSAVKAALTSLFELNNLDFGVTLNLGVVYKTIHSIEGVLYSTAILTGADPTAIQFMQKGTIAVTPTGGITSST